LALRTGIIEEENIFLNETERVAIHTNNNSDTGDIIQFIDNCDNKLLTSVRCAAHTLQLAIYDILKENVNEKKII